MTFWPFGLRPRLMTRHAGSVFLAVLALPSLLLAETISVPELNAKLDQWKTERKDPPPIVYSVEGRATLLGGGQLMFRHCRLPFRADFDIPRFTRRNSNALVTGMVTRDEKNDELRFSIQTVRELESDIEQYQARRRGLRQQPAARWYELADWARARGEFYKDGELLARSDEACREALDRERRELAATPQALFDLAAKATRLRLPQTVSDELVHEALARQWLNLRDAPEAKFDELLQAIAEKLPGATDPPSHPRPDLARAYAAAPLETYRAADAPTRTELHWLLYAQVLRRTIAAEVAAHPADAFAIADRVDKLLPELAESIRSRALASRAQQVNENLSRPEVLALADQYRQRGEQLQAEHVIESWLTLRRRKLDPDNVAGLVRLAEDYRTLLSRKAVADRLLIEAWQRNPGAVDIAERLQRAGYQLIGDNWASAAEVRARLADPIEAAIRSGRIEPGMSGSQVQRSLGQPQSIARSATSGQIVEIWTYDQAGSAKLRVRLHKNRHQTDVTVIDLTQSSSP